MAGNQSDSEESGDDVTDSEEEDQETLQLDEVGDNLVNGINDMNEGDDWERYKDLDIENVIEGTQGKRWVLNEKDKENLNNVLELCFGDVELGLEKEKELQEAGRSFYVEGQQDQLETVRINSVMGQQEQLEELTTERVSNVGPVRDMGLDCIRDGPRIGPIESVSKDIIHDQKEKEEICEGQLGNLVKDKMEYQLKEVEVEDSLVSEDPFQLYPIINRDIISKSKREKSKKKVSIEDQTVANEKEGREETAENLEYGANFEDQLVEGVDRRIKRGRKVKSVAEKLGLGRVELDGGSIISDKEIRDCNRLLLRSREDEAEELWALGNSMGLLEIETREEALVQFENWKKRDEGKEEDQRVRKFVELSNFDQ